MGNVIARSRGGIAVLCTLLAVGLAATGQEILYQPNPDSPLEARNPAAPAGIDQYAFLIGDWDSEVTLQRSNGEPLTYHATWHNHWIADGYVVMQEWRGPYATGIELRSYDAESNVWHGRNIYYPAPGTWYANTARFIDGRMEVTTTRNDPTGQPTITREIYFDIGESSFRIRTERSGDGGRTWGPGPYSLVARRTAPDP